MSRPLRAARLTRLVEADPKWLGLPDGTKCVLSFDCPIHSDCRVAVPFLPTFGGPTPTVDARAWARTGDTFEDVSLTPSIRVMHGPDGCEWHGFIRDGRFEHCGDAR